jgi:adenylate cyclase
MERDEAGMFGQLGAIRERVINPKVAEHGGRVVKTAGDGMLLEFSSADAALRCAIAVQRAMSADNQSKPPDERIEFRIGINLGDIIVDGNDIAGDGVNVAARLEALAEPGGICISSSVREQVHGGMDVGFDDIGEQQVKNIMRPIRVYRVTQSRQEVSADETSGTLPRSKKIALAAAALRPAWRWAALVVVLVGVVGTLVWMGRPITSGGRSPMEPPAMSVEIMSFSAPANDAAASRQAEALPRELTTVLVAAAHRIRVSTHNGTVGDGVDPAKLLRPSNARYRVEGNVRSGKDGNIVNLRLVDTATASEVWSRRFDLPDLDGSFEASRRLRILVQQLAEAVTGAETRRILPLPLEKLNATELVLRGFAALQDSAKLENVKEAQKLFDAALRLDPNSVFALRAASTGWDYLNDVDPHADRERRAHEMDALTLRAVNLDPGDPGAWDDRSQALAYAGRWTAAVEAIDLAIRLDPYKAWLPAHKAWLMTMTGRPVDALPLTDYATTLDPAIAGYALRYACEAYMLLGRNDDAVASCEKAAGTNSDWFVTSFLAAAYANRGDIDKAVAAKNEMLRTVPGYTITQLRAKHYSDVPEYVKMAEDTWYAGLRKAGIPEK